MANRFLNNIKINDAYTFPASDGTNGQFIATDGAGNLSFQSAGEAGATVIYKDLFTGNASTVVFTLANSVDNEVKTQVYFDGVYQSKENYTVSGNAITFSTAPPSGAAIEVITFATVAAADYNQKLNFYGKAVGAIAKGDAVMFAGAQGDHFLITKATQAALDANHEYFLGLAAHDFVNNQYGYVTQFGRLEAMDTSNYIAGDILWFDSAGAVAGALTTAPPSAPNTKIQIAAVVRVHQNEGVIFVRPTVYHEISELHDVSITSAADKDLLSWNATLGVWENTKTLGNITTGNITTSGTVDGVDVSLFKSDYDTHNHDSIYYTETEIDTLLTNKSNWDTAYSWGDHSLVGYLTSFTETDPIYTASSWYTTTNNSGNWNTAFGWGNHALAGYLTSYTETDPIYTASSWYTTPNNSVNWDTAYSWGNHAGLYSLLGHTHDYLPIGGKAADSELLDGIDSSRVIYGSNSTGTSYISGTTLDTALKSGFYTTNGGVPNATAVNFVLHTAYYGEGNLAGFDLACNDSTSSSFYLRPATGGGKGAWQTIITSSNIGSQSVNYANSAGTATDSSKLPLTGGTLTGTLTVNTNANQVAYFQSPNANTWVDIISTTRTWSMGSTSGSTWAIYDRGSNTTRIEVDTSSNLYSYGSMRSPIFYDSNDTGYYVDPNSTSRLNSLNLGQLAFVDGAGEWSNIIRSAAYPSEGYSTGSNYWLEYRAKGGHHFVLNTDGGVGSGANNMDDFTIWQGSIDGNRLLEVTNTGVVTATESHRAPIFYDSNNTNYYVDPNSNSAFVEGTFGQGSGYSDQGIRISYGNYAGGYGRIRFYQNGSNHSTIHSFSDGWQGGSLAGHSTGAINLEGNYGVTIGPWNNVDMWIDRSGNSQSRNSSRAPVFYDSNDTGYFLDPTAASNSKSLLVSGFVGWPNHQWTWSRGAHQDATNSIKIWDQYSDYGGSGNPTSYGTILHITGRSGHEDDQLYFSYDGQILHRNAFYGSDSWSSWNSVATARHGFTNNVELRAPIFYDSNDSSYYLDPNNTSVLNTVSLGAQTWRGQISWNAGVNIIVDGECSFDMYGGQWGVWNSETSEFSIVAPHGGQVQIGKAGSRGLYVFGAITASGDVTAYSDISVKENIRLIESSLDKVKLLNGVTYNRNDIDDKSDKVGFIAQEIINVLPEVVTENEDGKLSVAYGNITAVLVEAIKELSKKVEELENKLNGNN